MLVAALLAVALSSGAAAQQAPVLRAAPVAGGVIRLDGIPDEAVWQMADSLTGLRQRNPLEGAAVSERTVVRVLAAPGGLYVAFWAYDREPAGIRRTQLRRDANIDSDDYVGVVLDPMRDRRSGVVLGTNANGLLWDGQIVGADDVSDDWNGVWDVRSRVNADGWTAEFWIPWQNLRYPAAAQSFGFNVVRYIRRRNEESLWRGWRRNQGIAYLEDEGQLLLPSPPPPRGLFEGRPYLSASAEAAERSFDEASGADSVIRAARTEAKAGFDGKLALGSQLTLDVTANTDFAQVEADRQVVNLSRFPVFFPEKRQFFLEQSSIFAFGQNGRTQLFNSRSIGLDPTGAVVPIVAGARLTGRVGSQRVGLLASRTGGSEDAGALVARVQHDAFTRGYVGAMGTWRGGPGVVGDALAGGLDFNFPLLLDGQNIVPAGFVAVSRDGDGRPWASAWRLFLDYPNDWSDDFIAVSRIEPGFDPALGFVRQAGVWRYTAAARFFPRPGRWGIRRLMITPLNADITTDLDGVLDNASYEIRPLGIEFESGDEVELNVQRRLDAPRDSFELFDGTIIGPGHYWWNRVEAQFQSSSARPVVVELQASTGDFYTGRASELEYGVNLRLEPHVIVGVDGGFQRVSLGPDRFTAQVHRVRFDYATTPRLNTTLFLQWDNESDRLAVNARLHWIPRPGSDAYLVWNSTWLTGLPGGVPWRRPVRGALIGKFVYYFRR